MRKRGRATIVALGLAAVALATAACSTSSAGTVPSTGRAHAKTKVRQIAQYYVSLGDSYAAGYQPTSSHSGHTDTNGFAYMVPALAAKRGYDLKLVNFACVGATTESILSSPGCAVAGPGAPPYPGQTQAEAAEAFLKSHRGRVGLITVSIGGNDVTRCGFVADPVSCLSDAVTTIGRHLTELLTGVRAAAGQSVPIVGTTYPDVLLGLYLSGLAPLRSVATLSVTAFRLLLNPELKRHYEAVGGIFVDVTAATGAYGSLAKTTVMAPYGRIPVPVARVCQLTFFCQYHDIHPRTAGYRTIARLVVEALGKRR